MAFLENRTGLTGWFEASSLVGGVHGADVLSWPSQCAPFYGCTGAPGATGVYQENQLNGYPALLFDGANDVMTVGATWAAMLGANVSGSVVVLAKLLANPGVGVTVPIVYGGTGTPPSLDVSNAAGVITERAVNYTGTYQVAQIAQDVLRWKIYTWRHTSGGALDLYRNDPFVPVATVASGASAGAGTMTFGGGIGPRYSNCLIAAVLVYNVAHTTNQLARIVAYLRAKYFGLNAVDADHYSPLLRGDGTEQNRNVLTREVLGNAQRTSDCWWTGPSYLMNKQIGDVIDLIHQSGLDRYGVGGGWTVSNPQPHRVLAVRRASAITASLLLRPMS